MLFGDHSQPFATRNFLMDNETELRNDAAKLFAMLMQNSGQDGNSVRLQHAIQFRKEIDDEFRRKIAKEQFDGITPYRINGAGKGPHPIFGVSLDVGFGHLSGDWIDIAGVDLLRAQKPRGDRQNSRTGSQIKHRMGPLHPALQRFNGELGRFIRSGAESLSGVDSLWMP